MSFLQQLARVSALIPTRRQRVAVAGVAAALSSVLVSSTYHSTPGYHSDFGIAWFGARAMLDGRDPYPLLGPGREFDIRWQPLYPATAMVVAIPFAALTERLATMGFVAISVFLLAYGMTRDGWHLLPLFATETFASSARLGQWSILVTAALFLPWLAFLTVGKPQAFLPVLAASRTRAPIVSAVIGAVTLLLVSLALLPTWPSAWIHAMKSTAHMQPPILHIGGFLILLVLLKWRRPESWLVLAMACMPQSWGWYNTLPLFAVPRTLMESCALAVIVTLGGLAGAMLVPAPTSAEAFYSWVGSLLVVTIYLPVVGLILRRPNEGKLPAWTSRLTPLTRPSDPESRVAREPR